MTWFTCHCSRAGAGGAGLDVADAVAAAAPAGTAVAPASNLAVLQGPARRARTATWPAARCSQRNISRRARNSSAACWKKHAMHPPTASHKPVPPRAGLRSRWLSSSRCARRCCICSWAIRAHCRRRRARARTQMSRRRRSRPWWRGWRRDWRKCRTTATAGRCSGVRISSCKRYADVRRPMSAR